MKVKFTKASSKDSTLVTVTLDQFDDNWLTSHKKGDYVTIEVDGVPTIFVVNRIRNGKARTAVTYGFPRHLRLPTVGRPTYVETQGAY